MAKARQTKRVTITALARQLSLSICTVSRILNDNMGRTKYPEATIKRVRQAAARAGYQPNVVARSLVTGRSRTIGLCLADISNPHFADFAVVFEKRAAGRGIQTFICNTAEEASQELQVVQALLNRQVDSLVLSPTFDTHAIPQLDKASARGCRLILFDRQVPGLDAPCVQTNNYEAMRELCRRCLAIGHRTIGVIAGDQRDPTLGQRLQAVLDAAAAAGLPGSAVSIAPCDTLTSIASGQRQMAELLKISPRPTLFLSLANYLSVGALRAMRGEGLRAGRDVSFAGFDDFPGSDLLDPAVTVVTQPLDAMAQACADMALAVDAPAPEPVVIPSTLHWRDSVTPP